jgi:hypothetical protein
MVEGRMFQEGIKHCACENVSEFPKMRWNEFFISSSTEVDHP